MLWKKESTKSDSMYVDLFALNGGTANFEQLFQYIQREKPTSTLNKNGAMASRQRDKGNKYFAQGKWADAMESYNESLCYAENGSKNVSLAYANRSACFLKMKNYHECLVDIKLAKEAGYPAELMPKLDQRQEECLKAIEEGASSTNIEPKLSIASDELYPCISNVLKIDHDTSGDLALFAKENIDVGETIVVEKSFMTYMYTQYAWKCNICLKNTTNLMPCNKCTVAMFCSDECHADSLHKYECGLRYCNKSLANGTVMRVVRGCLLAIDMFSNADEFMSFVEETISSDQKQIPANLTEPKSKYAAFLKLPMKADSQNPHDFAINLSIAFSAQKMLMKIQTINSMFDRKKYRRFLIHLITHHYQVMEANSFLISQGPDYIDNCDEDYVVFESQTGLMTGYVKHSCAPNVYASKMHDKMVIITIRPIQKGQPLTKTFLMPLLTQTKTKRKQTLWQDRAMICKCVRCEFGDASATLRRRMRSDPNFQYIQQHQFTTTARSNDGAKQTMIDKCKHFLRQYGQCSWSIELGTVVTAYILLIDF